MTDNQETMGKDKRLICQCGNEMLRHVSKVKFTPTAFTDWNDWFFECRKCGSLYNRHGELVVQ